MREAYEKLKAAGVPVPAWPDMDSIESVRRFGTWFYTHMNDVEIQCKGLHTPMFVVFHGCSGRLARLKKERSERIQDARERYASKGNPFQPR